MSFNKILACIYQVKIFIFLCSSFISCLKNWIWCDTNRLLLPNPNPVSKGNNYPPKTNNMTMCLVYLAAKKYLALSELSYWQRLMLRFNGHNNKVKLFNVRLWYRVDGFQCHGALARSLLSGVLCHRVIGLPVRSSNCNTFVNWQIAIPNLNF